MGLKYNVYMSPNLKILACKKCKTHLSAQENIISKNFRGQHGQAFLLENVVNVDKGQPAEREMTTGRHIVRDIMCRHCSQIVGWYYDRAFDTNEKYKEGKYILELGLLTPDLRGDSS